MKVIFLDIDGVLNCADDIKKTKCKLQVQGGCIGIYLPRIKRLAKIVAATGAVIVLISSWKDSYTYYMNDWQKGKPKEDWDIHGKYLYNKFRKCGLKIYDTTYDYEPTMWLRGKGITNWIAAHPEVESWVVLDDEEFKDYESEGIIAHWVKSGWYAGGLNDDHVEQAIEILNKQ